MIEEQDHKLVLDVEESLKSKGPLLRQVIWKKASDNSGESDKDNNLSKVVFDRQET